MLSRLLLGWLSSIALLASLCSQNASAQAVQPPKLPNFPFPKIEGLPPQVQKELDRMFDPEALERELRRAGLGNIAMMHWGGLHLKKTNAKLQEQLGLPENEGLLVTAVDANSIAA